VRVYDSSYIQKSYVNVVSSFVQYAKLNSPARTMQTMQKLAFEDACEQQVYQLLVSHLLKSEALSPGGYEGFLFCLTKTWVEPSCSSFDRDGLDSLIKTFSKEDEELLSTCFDVAGLRGKIILSQHPINGEVDLAEINQGCFFPELIPAFELKATKFLSPRVICIDGFIESVAEIHRVLEDASTNKETIVLFVRGLADEVIRTLKVNYDRGSLQVIPVIVKYDLNDVNTLVDVAVASCSDVVSALKGDLISSIDVSKYDRIDSVDITAVGVLIENNKASLAIDSHIKKLQEKTLKSNNQYEKDSISKRIRNLGTNRVTIRLRGNEIKNERSLKIDRVLRAVKSSISHGISSLGDEAYPYAGLIAGQFFANRFFSLVKELGAVIV